MFATDTVPSGAVLEDAVLEGTQSPITGSYRAFVTTDGGWIRACQRLRYRVFAAELGARPHEYWPPGLDDDVFDDWSDHLVVAHEATGEVVGTCRLLPPDRGAPLYADGAFALDSLAGLRPELVELGRACVHPEHRGGSLINLMWATVARYALGGGHRYLAGCASVPLTDGGDRAAGVWRLIQQRHLAPEYWRVVPRRPWRAAPVASPPGGGAGGETTGVGLLRGYLRLGAWVCGPAAHDPDFNVADFFVLLPLDRVGHRHRDHFPQR